MKKMQAMLAAWTFALVIATASVIYSGIDGGSELPAQPIPTQQADQPSDADTAAEEIPSGDDHSEDSPDSGYIMLPPQSNPIIPKQQTPAPSAESSAEYNQSRGAANGAAKAQQSPAVTTAKPAATTKPTPAATVTQHDSEIESVNEEWFDEDEVFIPNIHEETTTTVITTTTQETTPAPETTQITAATETTTGDVTTAPEYYYPADTTTTTAETTVTTADIYVPDWWFTTTTAITTTAPVTTTTVPETTPAPLPAVNQTADFTFQDAYGNDVKLSNYFGKPIVLNFWASWCGPCKSEMPSFMTAMANNPDVTFLMVNLTGSDSKADALNFLSQNGYNFSPYFDAYNGGDQAYVITSIPTTLFINADGSLGTRHYGAVTATQLQQYINGIK
jgi:thiol-disulfide isomerase/thioredoxin